MLQGKWSVGSLSSIPVGKYEKVRNFPSQDIPPPSNIFCHFSATPPCSKQHLKYNTTVGQPKVYSLINFEEIRNTLNPVQSQRFDICSNVATTTATSCNTRQPFSAEFIICEPFSLSAFLFHSINEQIKLLNLQFAKLIELDKEKNCKNLPNSDNSATEIQCRKEKEYLKWHRAISPKQKAAGG